MVFCVFPRAAVRQPFKQRQRRAGRAEDHRVKRKIRAFCRDAVKKDADAEREEDERKDCKNAFFHEKIVSAKNKVRFWTLPAERTRTRLRGVQNR